MQDLRIHEHAGVPSRYLNIGVQERHFNAFDSVASAGECLYQDARGIRQFFTKLLPLQVFVRLCRMQCRTHTSSRRILFGSRNCQSGQ